MELFHHFDAKKLVRYLKYVSQTNLLENFKAIKLHKSLLEFDICDI